MHARIARAIDLELRCAELAGQLVARRADMDAGLGARDLLADDRHERRLALRLAADQNGVVLLGAQHGHADHVRDVDLREVRPRAQQVVEIGQRRAELVRPDPVGMDRVRRQRAYRLAGGSTTRL